MDKLLFDELLQSVAEMNDIARGRRKPSRVFHGDASQVKAVREATGLSQVKLAALINVNVSTLQNWEQGRRAPSGPAKALLKALRNDPVNVLKAMA